MLRETQTGGNRLAWKPLLAIGVFAAVLFTIGWRAWDVRRYRNAMVQIHEAMEQGHNALAARDLDALLSSNSGSDEAWYLLGVCEASRHRDQAAEAAWSRIPPGSTFAPQAIQGRIQLQVEKGRLAEAEQIVQRALADPRIDASGLPLLLAPIYCQQGRLEESLQLLQTRWEALNQRGEGASEPAVNLVRAHIDLRLNPMPVEMTRAALDQATQLAPEDDRVWLGKANLAVRAGSYDEARRWLDKCTLRRPEDIPVWRAWLEWALATSRVEEARRALEHLPARESTWSQIRSLAAWFAAHRRHLKTEERLLHRLINVDPANLAGLNRLTEIAIREGKADQAEELRTKKAKIEQLQARYLKLHQRIQPARDAAEMADIAGRLGQWFEARALLTLAQAVDPDRATHHDDPAFQRPTERLEEGSSRTLADMVGAELAAAKAAGD